MKRTIVIPSRSPTRSEVYTAERPRRSGLTESELHLCVGRVRAALRRIGATADELQQLESRLWHTSSPGIGADEAERRARWLLAELRNGRRK